MRRRLTFHDEEGNAQWSPELMEDTTGMAGGVIRATVAEYEDQLEDHDVVKVIRCRECKKSSYDKEFGKRWCNRDSVCVLVTDDDFCSRCDRG